MADDQNISAQIRGKIKNYAAAGKVQQGRLVVNGASMPQRVESDGSFIFMPLHPPYSRQQQRAGCHQPGWAKPTKNAVLLMPVQERFVHVYGWFSADGNTDLDLHVVTPDGEHAWYGNTVLKNSGALDMDVTTGYGPEIFAMPAPVHGRYQVYINYYGGDELN